MSLIVSLFVVTLVTQCWTAPQRRNWTPQAILYLKGAQGHRSVLQRNSRGKDDTSLSVTHKLSGDGLVISWASSVLLQLLQRAVEEGATLRDVTNTLPVNHPSYTFFLPQVDTN
ncbi:spexin prohormone 1-like [Pleuronectes platessa]|uniref:spexin prohormone 1-like n=1 Tax=Pleuronectes platessa TaxID=8262 RepID=UPI00232A1E56|nr:spexin prohormone 1-like [Pleuronectes platessa]